VEEAIAWLEQIYGPFGPTDGFWEEELAFAEVRLGLKLPSALRTLYLRTGRSAPLHQVHNQLRPPERIAVESEHLVFYEENQSVVVWGIPRAQLERADPPVRQAPVHHDRALEFFDEFTSVSEAARALGAWQAVQGGLPYVGVLDDAERAGTCAQRLGAPALTTVGLRAWLVPSGVATLADDSLLGLATRSAADFQSASAALGLDVQDWDYATLRDEAGVGSR
jgi:hypothetical protein